MISIERLTSLNTSEYLFAERLIIQSFPKDEYRDLNEFRNFVENKSLFYLNIIKDENRPVGLISYWDLTDFYYIEHFAIDAAIRNKGYGQTSMSTLIKQLNKGIVLEVELPNGPMEKRRIAFYERLGFTLQAMDYIQPAYKPDSHPLPMKLMTKGNFNDIALTHIKKEIYEKVYGK